MDAAARVPVGDEPDVAQVAERVWQQEVVVGVCFDAHPWHAERTIGVASGEGVEVRGDEARRAVEGRVEREYRAGESDRDGGENQCPAAVDAGKFSLRSLGVRRFDRRMVGARGLRLRVPGCCTLKLLALGLLVYELPRTIQPLARLRHAAILSRSPRRGSRPLHS